MANLEFGKYFLVVEKTKEEDGKKARYKTLGKELWATFFEEAKKHIYENGFFSPRNRYALPVEKESTLFYFFAGEYENNGKKEDCFFASFKRQFIIEVVTSLEYAPTQSRFPKLFLVFKQGSTSPYYMRLSDGAVLNEENVTKEEVYFIKEFERGLGVIHDTIIFQKRAIV